MSLQILFVLSVLTVCLWVLTCKKETELFEGIALVIGVWFCGYVVISGLLLWFGLFSFVRVLLLQILVALIPIGVRARNGIGAFPITQTKRNLLIYVILGFCLFATHEKFAFFGMGQDQGVYQTNALEFASGNFSTQFDFEEYHVLQDAGQKEAYADALLELSGLYRYQAGPITPESERISEVSAVYHGIPTFPAFLGLFAAVFGTSNMQLGQTALCLAAMLFLLLAAENLCLKPGTTLLVLATAALSPVVVWVSKSALTECGFMMLMAWYLYCITMDRAEVGIPMSLLPISALCFYHASAFVLIPLFIVILVVLDIQQNQNCIKPCGILLLLVFLIGLLMMMRLSPYYCSFNIGDSLKLPSDGHIIPTMLLLCVVLALLLLFYKQLRIEMLYRWLTSQKVFPWFLRIALCVVGGLILGYFLAICQGRVEPWKDWLQPYYQSQNKLLIFSHLSIYILSFATGMAVLPVLLYFLFVRPQWALETKRIPLCICFFYCILFMAALLRREIYYNYYYARYYAPYIFVLALFAGTILDALPDRFLQGVLIFTVVAMMPFSWFIARNKDQSQIPWDTLQSVCDEIEEDSAIIVSDDYWLSCALPLRAMTDSHVYPLFDDVAAELASLSSTYRNVYVVSGTLLDVPTMQSNLTHVETFTVQQYQREETAAWIPFPLNTDNFQRKIYLGSVRTEDYIHQVSTLVGIKSESGIAATGASGYLMYGPYLRLARGTYAIEIIGHIPSPSGSLGTIDVIADGGRHILLEPTEIAQWVDTEGNMHIQLTIEPEADIENCEIRIAIHENVAINIQHLYIVRCDRN